MSDVYFLIPHRLKNGPEYTVIEVNWTIVTVIGYGKSDNKIFPTTLLLLEMMYHIKHKIIIVTTSRLSRLSSMIDVKLAEHKIDHAYYFFIYIFSHYVANRGCK